MSDIIINSAARRLFYSLGTMFIIISILIAAILLFVSFGKGASWERGFTGVILAIMSFILIWLSSINRKSITTTWYGVLAGIRICKNRSRAWLYSINLPNCDYYYTLEKESLALGD